MLGIAEGYTQRGWRCVPVPFKSKAPILTGWQRLRLEKSRLGVYFDGKPANLGVLLGEPSGGLKDVDLDCPEGLVLASSFLPPTASRFGRASKRASHWLYLADPLVSTEKFEDAGGAMLVELRSTGAQTVFPPSTHPTGEVIAWDEDGEPARVDGAALRQAVAELAVACLLARHWPAQGARHDAALAVAGFLVRGGLDEGRAAVIVQGAARAAGDEEWRDRRSDVLSTVTRLSAGEPVVGGPTLAQLLAGDGAKVVATIRRWLRLHRADDDRPTLTDAGNAARFAAQHRQDVRYVFAWRSWLEWDGTRWRRDPGDGVVRRAKATAKSLYAEAAAERNEVRRKALAAWAVRSESEPAIRRMVELAKSEPGIPITPEDLDRDPWLLNCPNGTVELRTGHLRPHRREDFLTKITAAPYDPAAQHPVFARFLEQALPDDDTRAYVQRVAGYALTGDTREEALFFAHGPTAGGKSTFLEALRRTWGDYAATADFSTFLARKHHDGPREDIARLAGVRLVTSVETRDARRFADGLVKTLTGGDTVTARRFYENSFEFVPRFKLLLAANSRPHVSAEDDALWRRLREIPFPLSLRPEDRNPAVKKTLTDPAQAGSAILAWAVEGCHRWLSDGLGTPQAVAHATENYRQSQDPLGDFLAECCVLGHDLEVSAERLRQEYDRWCREAGIRTPVTGKPWGVGLRERGCTATRHDGARFWRGIDIRLADADPAEPGATDVPTGMTG